MTSVSVVISSPPTPDLEALELPLALAAFDHEVTLVFVGAGVLWLSKSQQSRKPEGKSPSKFISALPMYECEQVFCSIEDLQRFGLSSDAVPAWVQIQSDADLSQHLNQPFSFGF
ncbi:MAG: DsrE family protein [Oceanobacter sp.]